jgi:hypothetical protein
VAKGLFAPGHLGERTQIVPFEMVDAALAETGAVQQRLRKIPARVVVCLLLAAALEAIPVAKITGTALRDARTRLGVRPMRALFDLLRGPATAIRNVGARLAALARAGKS